MSVRQPVAEPHPGKCADLAWGFTDGLRCACGVAELIAIAPGSTPPRWTEGGFLIGHGSPLRAWCAGCAPWCEVAA